MTRLLFTLRGLCHWQSFLSRNDATLSQRPTRQSNCPVRTFQVEPLWQAT